jgi:uncharacterized damage-inducible protein DinB
MNRLPRILAATATGIALSLSAFANHHESKPLFTQMVLSSLDASSGKIVQLAETFSEEQYAWRPMEGVNSVQEAILHVAGANYFISGMLGHPAPAGVDVSQLGKGASKEEIIKIYQASLEHAKAAVAGVTEAAMNEEIDMFGQKAPRARLVLVVSDHSHEHLGQLIAYARSNQVVPPWSVRSDG